MRLRNFQRLDAQQIVLDAQQNEVEFIEGLLENAFNNNNFKNEYGNFNRCLSSSRAAGNQVAI